jgi:hypothetical protein
MLPKQDTTLSATKLTVDNGLANHINEYSRRILSYDTDDLDAFQGVLARTSCHTHFGIPIVPDGCMTLDVSFAVHLAWVGDFESPPLRRRFGLPSWSRGGWAGPINLSSWNA